MIKINNLSKIYEMSSGNLSVLRNINLTVEKGEFLAIVGTSGSGKSTLMNILGCLDRPTSGKYELSGRDVSSITKSALSKVRNREIGFIFQGFNLLENMTASDNVELPMIYARIPPKRRREIALDALSHVGLSERIHHRPFELSGGQQQRVAIARAIALKPPLILADEPTGNLDLQSGEEVLSILHDLHSHGTTIVLITHDMSIANRASRVIEISDGKIIQK